MPARADAGIRLHRLLAVLTWLARQGRAPVAELAERFGIDPDELIADLELAACCGLPPYTPDQLMEIMVDEEEVVANLGPELARPRRLTAAEGFALATVGARHRSRPRRRSRRIAGARAWRSSTPSSATGIACGSIWASRPTSRPCAGP